MLRWLRRRQQRSNGRSRRRQHRRSRMVHPVAQSRWRPGTQAQTTPPKANGSQHRKGFCRTADRPDPLAALRGQRDWIDRVPEAELWQVLRQIRWAGGNPGCPHCGEDDPAHLEIIDRSYRGGLYRYRCLLCHLAGDPGEGGTFTDLTGTLFEGCRLDIRSLWLLLDHFADQHAAVDTAREVQVNRHTVDRYFRLLRGAIYQARSWEPIALDLDDIAESDEVYITAGLKGQAGGEELSRNPRRRGLKRRGRGTWDSDRVPVLGLICRQGQLRLFVLRNVQTRTIQPIMEQLLAKGVKVYTDNYCIYNFLARQGYQHAAVNHGAGEYARDEVHCNTIECTWSWLRQAIRTYRGVSKIYLPLYVAQFEFFYNRRHLNGWNQTIDVLNVAFQADAAALLANVQSATFAEVCPVAG